MGVNMEIENARIKSTQLGIEDHGIFTFFLHLEYDGAGQGFGGYALDEWSKKAETRVGSGLGIEMIRKILEVVGVDNWEDLPGKYIRVEHDNMGVYQIGHITKNKWFSPKELFTK